MAEIRRFRGDTLLLATHNQGKLQEMRDLLAPFGVRVLSAKELQLPEPEETESTFVGNARIKARAAMEVSGLPCLADDSGLCVDALGGAPGVYTADWATTPGGRDFKLAMTRTWQALEASGSPQPWTARFRSTLVLLLPDGQEYVFEGAVSGHIVWPPRGEEGHGFDPMFVPDGHDVTFAEMAFSQKNQISHRAAAFRALIEGCFT